MPESAVALFLCSLMKILLRQEAAGDPLLMKTLLRQAAGILVRIRF